MNVDPLSEKIVYEVDSSISTEAEVATRMKDQKSSLEAVEAAGKIAVSLAGRQPSLLTNARSP